MNSIELFNKLFSMGFSFEKYKTRSDRQIGRMNTAWKVASEEIDKLPNELIQTINQPLKVLVIAENWCGDCGNGVPVISKLAEICDKWDYKIVGKDDIEDLLDTCFYSEGKIKIPTIIFATQKGEEIARWVERPKKSYFHMAKLKSMGLSKEEFIAKYKATPELQTENVAKEVLRELLFVAEKVGLITTVTYYNKK